ncbi:hypothetical protein BT63DRAFT_405966 [Microthyrium microscopicum]|uniref:Uncharacterized protein n=1 Tax=Microthyrium microscopicum TaxID=703497 RepID=A0A6A6TYT6_9PEZI|nr:hypothetical protein BT63DRAFT_405966 [Microthyrium microscopicum]
MPTPSSPPATLRKPAYTDTGGSLVLPKQRPQSPSASISSLPFRSNPSISSLYASTSLAGSIRSSGASTPTTDTIPGGSTLYSDGKSGSTVANGTAGSPEVRTLIARAFAPHVGVVSSTDTEALLRERGFSGGLLELIRPYGESVSGRVTVRDSIGASRTWDDFGIRFVGLKDGLSSPRLPGSSRPSLESRSSGANGSVGSGRSKQSVDVPRLGGDVSQIEEVVDRHLNFAELRPSNPDYLSESQPDLQADSAKTSTDIPLRTVSPFYTLYLRRLLSGLPLTPHETFSHPVACVIATSSRNPAPIEEFKRLYTATNTGDDRLPQWVNNEYLRYYVLIHDEDNDDIQKSVALYEQMKRHFGLHCHLLRLRSSQCVPSDDDSTRLPISEWMTAGEELAAIHQRETSHDLEDPTPCLFESDAAAIRTFVRELVTQSIVPGMERLCAQWNEQVATRRKGLSGRLLSVGKRWGFGLSRNSSTPVPSVGSSSYDSLQGFYRPDTPEALMRKLADYAFMLRDFKLAQQTYDVLRSDFEHDKAWKYYAGANEMYLVSTMLNTPQPINKRLESIERWLEAAVHSYVHRCDAPFYALRTLLLAFEAAKARGSLSVDDAAKWPARVLAMSLTGPIGRALVMERIASCYGQHRRPGARRRKRALWSLMAADAWAERGKTVQAEQALADAKMAYGVVQQVPPELSFMIPVLQSLQERIVSGRLDALGHDEQVDEHVLEDEMPVDPIEEVVVSEELGGMRQPRRGLLATEGGGSGEMEGVPLSPVRTRSTDAMGDEGFV